MHLTTQGIVLREVNYKESDKILTVLTRDLGKLTVKARACRRKNSPLAAASQLLVYSELTLFEYRDYWSMDQGDSLEQFWGVRQDVEKLALGSYFAEVMEVISVEGRPDPAAMSLILNSLHALDKLNKPQALVKAVYEMKLMCLEGYEPLADACAVCGRADPEGPMLSLAEGVLHCAACKKEVGEGLSLPLTEGALSALRHIVYGDPKRLFSFALDAKGLDCLARACEGFLRTQMDRGFRTLDFYQQLKAGM